MKVLRRPIESAQYTSIHYTQRLEDIKAVRSVGSKGDSYDNPAAESVNSLYKKELINFEGRWQGAGHVTVETADWVSWYNNERIHSACGNVPPAEYENAWIKKPGSYYNNSRNQSFVVRQHTFGS
jgi:putative transposase